MQKNKIYCYYKYCSKLFGKMRRETEFRRRCCWNCKKKYNVSGERENWILVMGLLKFLSCLYCQACSWSAQNAGECLKWKAIVAMALLKMGEKKKKRIVATKLLKMEGKKKDATSITFFTTNYRWLVVIGSNLNLILRLLFCPNNNNQ